MLSKEETLEAPGAVATPRRLSAAKWKAGSAFVADVAVASIILLLGVLVLVEGIRLGIGWGSDGPKSGFVPFWLAAIMIASCVVIIVQAIRHVSEKPFATAAQLGRVAKVLLPAAAMIALIPFVGLYAATALYMAGSMRWSGRYSWSLSIGLPFVVVVLTFFVFERWFLVPLPKGPLETWLGY